jgi:hypothetical protein
MKAGLLLIFAAPLTLLTAALLAAILRHKWAGPMLLGSAAALTQALAALVLSAWLFQTSDTTGPELFFALVMNTASIACFAAVSMVAAAKMARPRS